jgi:cobaltochelatase CobT
LLAKLDDLDAFAQFVDDMLVSINIAEQFEVEPAPKNQEKIVERESEGNSSAKKSIGYEESSNQSRLDDADATPDEDQQSAKEATQKTANETEDHEGADVETPSETRLPNNSSRNFSCDFDYRVFTTSFDETVGADELCDEQELEQMCIFLDKQPANLQDMVGRLANRLQRRLMAQRSARDVSTWRRYAGPRALCAHCHQPQAAFVVQAGARHAVLRHDGHAALLPVFRHHNKSVLEPRSRPRAN